MTTLRRGWTGEDVKALQRELEKDGVYRGPIDGIFGGGTEAAVRQFQSSHGLLPDGVVGGATWNALTSSPQVGNDMVTRPLAYRCLALTGTFETGTPPPDCFAGLSGDFNGQGLSLGVCQWCIGQGSLQPLLGAMNSRHPDVMKSVFGPRLDELLAGLAEDVQEELAWVRSIQSPKCNFFEPWAGYFKALGRTPEFQGIQVAASDLLFQDALKLCRDYGLKTERAVALMFDIKTQNGSIRQIVKAQIMRDFTALTMDEPSKLRAIANRRAEASKPQWIEDVRRRKLCIANGEGTVHGNKIDLEAQFGIRLQTAVELT